MSTIKHILFPADFSPRADAAVPFVRDMVERLGARLTILSVAQPAQYSGLEVTGLPVYVDPDELRLGLQSQVDSAFAKELAGLDVTRVAMVGDPVNTITEFAKSGAVDLIMMPTRGYGTFRKLLLGSVAAKVLRDSACPVWTSAHLDTPVSQHISCQTVLCAVDGTDKSGPLIASADKLAAQLGLTLHLVHAIPQDDGEPEHARKAIKDLAEAFGVSAPMSIARGNPAEALAAEARRFDADLLVIGRSAPDGVLGRLRTHAYSIIRQSPCPVLSF